MRRPIRIQEKIGNIGWLVVVICLAFAACGSTGRRPRAVSSGGTDLSRINRELALAEAHFDAGRYAAALAGYAPYIRSGVFESRKARILFRAAYAAFKTAQPALFREYSALLSRLFPGHENIAGLAGLSWEVSLQEKKYLQAIGEMQRVLDSYRQDRAGRSRIFFLIAESYERLYRKQDAIDAYLQVVRNGHRDNHMARALLRLANWAHDRKQHELALHYANRLLDEFPLWGGREQAETLRRVSRWRYIRKVDGLADDSVSDILFDGDDVWVATWLGGITRFTRSSGQVTRFKASPGGLVSNLIRSMTVARNRVWVATFEGLSYYDKAYGHWKTIETVAGLRWQRIKKVVFWDNRLWVATIGHGLSVLDLKTGSWRTYGRKDGLPGDNVVTLCATPGSVWAGTVTGGVGRLDLLTGRWTVYRAGGRDGLPTNNVKAIAFDGTRMWFGTHGKGVVSCTEQGEDWKTYNTANSGLTSNYVYSLAFSPRGELWLGTLEGGAVSFNPQTGKWARLGIRDGLPGNDIIAIAFEKRHIWFGTLNGGVAILLSDEERKKNEQK